MLEPVVRPFLNSPNDQNMLLHDVNARLNRADTTEEYKNQHHIFHGRARRQTLNPI